MAEISGIESQGVGLSAREFADLVDDCWQLASTEPAQHADPKAEQAALIDKVRFWEELKAVAAARQARATVSFAKLRREMPRAVPGSEDAPKRSVSAEIALARRDSPASGVASCRCGEGAGGGDAPHDGGAGVRRADGVAR